MDLIELIGSNEKAFTVMVAFFGILGGIAGNWIGAWLQSRAGRAQASAAMDAARITAEAQRLAALHTDRRVLLARLVETARQADTAIFAAFEPASGGASEDDVAAVGPLVKQMLRQETELSLVAPKDVVRSSKALREATQEAFDLLVERGPARRAQARLDRTVGMDADRASDMLDQLKSAYRERLEEDIGIFHSAARQALWNVPGLEDLDTDALADDARKPPVEPLFRAAKQKNEASLDELVKQARWLLSAERVDTRPH
ncbi:hypothetical protein [Streptomyces sp. AK02-01A]|uniref:hypothetical protein n=1 Tax=Streptomyces sp. AK02-01A TaxID=3028648 RepID=UPI0029A42048|nr:hypothetical protein [Streptomyces sp. AK02-01A]MDX3854865.1 hypothetical protein [Streptomyces sp. AK02-01A]